MSAKGVIKTLLGSGLATALTADGYGVFRENTALHEWIEKLSSEIDSIMEKKNDYREALKKMLTDVLTNIALIENDDRYKSYLEKPAQIMINAPLALIQVDLVSRLTNLEWMKKEGLKN